MSGKRMVYRGGSRTNQALTPRAGVDTVAPNGLTPGLSVEDKLEDALGEKNRKAQRLDLEKLKRPLIYVPDNPGIEGGRSGHGVITPVDDQGRVDHAVLEEWANS